MKPNEPATITAQELWAIAKADARLKEPLFDHLVHETVQALDDFQRANAGVEQHRDRIVRECASLNCRRDSDCVDAGWILNATNDLVKTLEQRNAAYARAIPGLRVLHEIGVLPEKRVPDYAAPVK